MLRHLIKMFNLVVNLVNNAFELGRLCFFKFF